MAKKNDVCRCIARVYRWGALRPHRCSNPVWKDGYCKTHQRRGMDSHTETIICPECDRIQIATVEHTFPWHSYVHECECGHVITESEWEEEAENGRTNLTAGEHDQ